MPTSRRWRYSKNGARVSGDRVFIDERLLTEALKSAPPSFTLHGRETEDAVVVGAGRPVYAPASGPVYVKRGSEKRPATRQDFIDLLKLSQSSAVLGVTNYIVVEPQDLDESRRKIFQVAAALKYTTKPLVGDGYGRGKDGAILPAAARFLRWAGRVSHARHHQSPLSSGLRPGACSNMSSNMPAPGSRSCSLRAPSRDSPAR